MKTMNRCVIITIGFALCFANILNAQSRSVEIETAKRIAQNFMSNNRNISKTATNVVVEKFEEQNSLYVVNFQEGGWVMLSAENTIVPILAFSYEGIYRVEDEKSPAFCYLIDMYKEQIDIARKIEAQQIDSIQIDTIKRREIAAQWASLQIAERESVNMLRSYIPGRVLLNVPQRGEVTWGQSKNNDSSCSPAYNAKVPTNFMQGWLFDCTCNDTPPAGCGAVAMGQVMWYWKWPKSSKYRSYDWGSMPTELLETTPSAQADAIAFLLKDCGSASNMVYACAGSFTTSIESALENDFNYKGITKVTKRDWSGSVWNDLIRTEIDCERPVIMYGEKALTLDKKHYFVIDGYDVLYNNYFHINLGWRGTGNGYFYLNNITGTANGGFNFNSGQYAFIGISPTYSYPNSVNITDVSYTTVTGVKKEEAQRNITLPASGKTLTVKNGGDLTLVAGNKISFKQGFKAEQGSRLKAQINQQYANITVASYPSQMNKINGTLQVTVTNANSFDFMVRDTTSNTTIYQQAGLITTNTVVLWDGNGASFTTPSKIYQCTARFRNNNGRLLEHTWFVTVLNNSTKSTLTNDSIVFEMSKDYNISEMALKLYPNPSIADVSIEYNLNNATERVEITLHDSNGKLVYKLNNNQAHEAGTYTITLQNEALPVGIYICTLKTDKQVFTEKFVKQ